MSGALVLIIVAVMAVYAAATGFLKQGSISTFEPKVGPMVRQFRGEPECVVEALSYGVARTPGATVVQRDGDSILVSTTPTPMMMRGSVGLFVRMRFSSQVDGITTVVVEAQPKVAMVSSTRVRASMVQLELDVRMAARSQALLYELT